MKKIIFLSLVFFSLTFQAQVIVQPGTYKSSGENLGVEIKINADDTYELIMMSGKLVSKSDSIYLENKYKQESNFLVSQFENSKNSKTIGISFNSKYISSYYNPVYIGTQKSEKSPIEYKVIADYQIQEIDSSGYGNSYEDIVFSVDRVKYIYLVEEKNKIATASKYEIKETVSNLEIVYSPYSLANINLRGYIKDDKFVISDGTSPLIFSLNSTDNNKVSNTLNAVNTRKDSDFVAPVPLKSPDDYYYGNDTANFDFKFTVDNSLKDALKTIQKTPNKFLVITYNPTSKNEKEDFNNYLKSQEAIIKSSMYDEYQPQYDLYNYYLASSKDENLFDKKSKRPQIVVLNANGNKLYHTTGTLTENQDLFNYYSELSTKLPVANVYASLDVEINNKKATVVDLKKIFKNSLNSDKPYVDRYTEELAVPTDAEDAVEVQGVDSAGVSESYDDYGKLKDEQNLYTFKTSKQTINTKWKEILDYYKKQSTVDEDLVSIIKKEIENDGFTIRLFLERKQLLTDLDFEGIDYLLNNYEAIIQIEKQKLNETANDTLEKVAYDSYESFYEKSLNEVLESVFLENSNNSEGSTKAHFEKTMNYYKKYSTKNKENLAASVAYINALENNLSKLSNKNELYTSFESYFNKLTSQSPNLIESLDIVFTKNNETRYDYNDWTSFKNSFSNLANSVSWAVVENEKDLTLIKNAIKWSETSLKLEKQNGYYLDTLAQLYYKNNQKELAITTQKLALEAMQDSRDSDIYMEIKAVLIKMQNNSY